MFENIVSTNLRGMSAPEAEIALPVRVEARVRHRLFDLSGGLPFQVVISVARCWPKDKDSLNSPDPLTPFYIDKPLTIRIQRSLLDVEYALKHGYLYITDGTARTSPRIDFSDIELGVREPEFVTLESGAGSKRRAEQRYTELFTKLDPQSPIGKRLKPNQQYRLWLPIENNHFPVDEFYLGEGGGHALPGSVQKGPSKSLILYAVGRRSNSPFRTIPSISIPPEVTVSLTINADNSTTENSSLKLRVKVVNKNSRSITLKSTGEQAYLAEVGRILPYIDDRPRITRNESSRREKRAQIHWSNISIRGEDTDEEMVKEYTQPCTLSIGPDRPPGKSDSKRRYTRDQFTTLEPNIPFEVEEKLETILPAPSRLGPGAYRLTLRAIGAMWFWGTSEELFAGEDSIALYPQEEFQRLPVMLASEDQLVFSVSPGPLSTDNAPDVMGEYSSADSDQTLHIVSALEVDDYKTSSSPDQTVILQGGKIKEYSAAG